jgi:putative colanic acid biosynthesis acetyltransferase WcaF
MPWNLDIGDWSSIGEDVLVYNLGKIKIGKNSTISHRAHLCAGTHDYSKSDLPLLKLPIIIEDQVWVCASSFVGPNVKIESGAIVGACAVVTKDVEAWSIVAGNPAKVLGKRVLN